MKAPRRTSRVGLRREIAILLPTSLLLLGLLAIFTLFSYRQGIDRLAEGRRLEAARLAQRIAAEWRPSEGVAGLRRRAPLALAIAVIAPSGAAVQSLGDLPPVAPLAPLRNVLPRDPVAVGPDAQVPGRVAAFAPLPGGGALRLDLDAATLDQLRRSQRVLSVTVLGITAATLLLVVSFAGHLLRPYEALLARARELGGDQPGGRDEVEFLLSSFDRAMAALARTPRPLAAGVTGAAGSGDEEMAELGRTLVPSLESGLLLLDREGHVLALNPLGGELLGVRSPSERLPLREVLAPHGELAAFLEQQVSSSRGVQRHELTLPGGDGGRDRTLGLTVHPLRHGDGATRGFLVLFADLTDARRAAEEVRLADSLASLGELSAGVAHELRNSLGTLRGYLALLARTAPAPPASDYLEEMRRETEQVQRVVDDFLTFARPGTARLEPVRLDQVLRRVAEDPALAASPIEVAISAELAAQPAVVSGDEQLLARAVRNLVQNAAQANRAAASTAPVLCRLAREDDDLALTVEDRGAGIPEELRARLFHPFATGRAGGVGLGLALTHRIVDLHGGRVRIEDREGGGTRAKILFPADTIVTDRNALPRQPSGSAAAPAA